MKNGKGFLVLIGGAEDRTDKLVILRKILDLNRGKNVVIIPSATLYTTETIKDYSHIFRGIGAEKVEGIDVSSRSETDRSHHLDALEDADIIFFTGGDQTRLVDILCQTKIMDKIREKHEQGSIIAGTSAGAAAASDPMIYDGDDEGFNKSAVKHTKGFGFLRDITIDTHFMERKRIPRLSQFLSSGKSQKGIGISEDTAIIVSPDEKFEVIGSGIVTVMNSEAMWYSNYDNVSSNKHITVDGVKIGFLAKGTVFDLKEWRVDRGEHALVPKEARYDIIPKPERYETPSEYEPKEEFAQERKSLEYPRKNERPAKNKRRDAGRGERQRGNRHRGKR